MHGATVTLPSVDNERVQIDLFGSTHNVSLKRLAMLAWYELGEIPDISVLLDNVRFRPIDCTITKVHCRYIAVFDNPVEYGGGFRRIASYPRYAINISGDVLDTHRNEIVAQQEHEGYRTVYIHNPDKNQNRTTRVHRLVALTWIPNDDYRRRAYVNHIDGRRNNNQVGNLEWCSLSENARHAYDTGLNTGVVAMKTRNVSTGEVRVFNTVQDMSRWLGLRAGSAENFTSKLPGYLFNRKYEIKRLDDTTPWYYEGEDLVNIDNGPIKSIYSIEVLDRTTGAFERFSNLKPFIKRYKLKTRTDNIAVLASIFSKSYPTHVMTYRRNAVTGPYTVVDTVTDRRQIVGSISAAAEIINVTRSGLQFDLVRKRKFKYHNRWVVFTGECAHDLNGYVNKPEMVGRSISAAHVDGGSFEAGSIREAARKAGLDVKTVTKHLNSDYGIKGWTFRALAA